MTDPYMTSDGQSLGDMAPNHDGINTMLGFAEGSAVDDAFPSLGAAIDGPKSPAYGNIRSAIKESEQIIRKTASDVQSLINDKTLYPDGRADMIRAKYAEADAKLKELDDRIEVSTIIAKAELEAQALPKPGTRSEQSLAMQQAQMFIQGAPDPAKAFAKFAARDDTLGAMLVGEFGRDLLDLAGVKAADAVHNKARLEAIAKAAGNGDRAAIARLSLDAQSVQKVRMAVQSARGYLKAGNGARADRSGRR